MTWVCVLAVIAQVAGPANSGYKTTEGRAQVASVLTAPGRDARQKPAELAAALGIKPGMTVVDLGTGVGYMLPYLSPLVGNGGIVVAEDIHKDFLDQARALVEKDKLANVRFVLGTEQDPNLPARSADLILVLDAYHHFDYPERMLAKLGAALRPGGRLALVEYYKRRGAMEGDPDRALKHIRLDLDDVVKEVEASGFRLISQKEQIPRSQYVAIFGKK